MEKDLDLIINDAKSDGEAFERMLNLIRYLRAEGGCEWDRKQNHKTLKKCLVEESYEVLEAIDNDDMENLEEEIGDIALQVVFHSLIGEEKGHFNAQSAINRCCNKMIYRHPHIFEGYGSTGDYEFSKENVQTIDNSTIKWENMKRKEKEYTNYYESMMSIPKSLPALMRSKKIQAKAAMVGFDWDDVSFAFDKITEETTELREAISKDDKENIFEEVGDLLFTVVNIARFLNVEPEESLNFTSNKFLSRFKFIEDTINSEGKSLDDVSLEEMDRLWEESKKNKKRV